MNPDAIVVGSGAGGAAAAYRLVMSGLRVLHLEKGNRLPTDGSTLDVERVVHRGEFLSREAWRDGRGARLCPEEHFNVGGKTKWYGAALVRFSPEEFAADSAHGCRGWPIAHAEMVPYYQEAESLLGVREIAAEPGLARILTTLTGAGSRWRSAPMPLALAPEITQYADEAAHFDGFASARQLKGEAEHSFIERLAGHPRYALITGAEVVALQAPEGSPERICGVRLADGRQFLAEHVVLAAGALHSPRLLARHLHASALAATLPMAAHVGCNLKLHLLTALVAVGVCRQDDLIRKTRLLTHEHYPHSSVQPLGFDSELIETLMPMFLPQALRRALGERAYGFFLQTEDGSDARNRVREQRSDSAFEPVLDYDEQRLSAACREHRDVTRALQRSLLRAGLLGIGKRIGPAGTAHACGTLVCGDEPASSVVDTHGRVHGLQGLYVADGSILPRSSHVNPSLSIYAWGLRVGALIAKSQRSPAVPTERAALSEHAS
jgi:choline dehydrogenase-like flavoprotein